MRLIIPIVIISLICAALGIRLARKKGYNPNSWAVWGFSFPIIALIIQLLVKDKNAQ